MALKDNAVLMKGLSWGGSVLIHGAVLATLSYWPSQENIIVSSSPKAISVELISLRTQPIDRVPQRNKKQPTQKKIAKQQTIQQIKEAAVENSQKSLKRMEKLPQPVTLAEKASPIVNDPQKSEERIKEQDIAVIQYKGSAFDNPLPVYPLIARQRHLEGRVVLKVLVGRESTILDIALLESSGYDCLDQSALAAVQQWKFDALDYAREKPVYILVPVSFRLNKTEIS
jgi:protein TonB